ncbi:lasso RiPP family leader peptide-containing protein [Streptomyces hoynatensis]|uniref:Lasso RiPP family leader peptide-containing protein n=1 Tax=Streptomyces hoynatensis TaxID=1141874 RepID=A0A3A9ZI78_9ACTN|nr:lasso RiPP family leader peptide-containing protein [Streptomyces hoynatensis]
MRAAEPREVYVPPVLAAAGGFAEETRGHDYQGLAEGNNLYWCGAC